MNGFADEPDPHPERPTRVRYLVLGWLSGLAAIAYVQRNSISAMAQQIQRDLELSDETMGWVLSGLLWSYAIVQIPTGWLGHFWGSRKALAVFTTLSSMMTVLLACPGGFATFLVGRLGAGVAQAGMFPSCVNSFSKWFPPSQRALPNGFLGSAMSLGAMIGTLAAGWLIQWISWQSIFVLLSLPGFVWAALFYLWFRDQPAETAAVNRAELDIIREGAAAHELATIAHETPAEPTPWLAIFLSPAMIALCGQQFFRAAGYSFYGTWFPKFLTETRGVSLFNSAALTCIPLAGVTVGSFLGGPFSDWLLARTGSRRVSRQWVGAVSQFLCGGLCLGAYYIDDASMAVCVIALGAFCFAFGSCAAYTLTIDMGGNHVATVFSTMNMAGNFGAAACPVVVGYVVGPIGWNGLLFFFAGIYFVAGAFWLGLNPTGTIYERG